MADIYEFHVSGLIGPVVRSALPELVTEAASRDSVLSGTASGPDDVDQMLRRLGDAGLTATHIVITSEKRWQHPACPAAQDSDGAVPVVHDNGS